MIIAVLFYVLLRASVFMNTRQVQVPGPSLHPGECSVAHQAAGSLEDVVFGRGYV